MGKKIMYQQGRKFLVVIGWVVTSYLAIVILPSCTSSTTDKSVDYGEEQEKYNRVKKYLLEFNSRYSSIDTFGWEIQHFYETEIDVTLDIHKEKNDTTYYAELYISKYDSIIGNNEEKFYKIFQYIKSYSDSSYRYFINFKDGVDTLYYYKSPLDDLDDEIFIMGKYQYQYTYPMLDSLQSKYYLEHKDSLDLVRGNDLLELPRINE